MNMVTCILYSHAPWVWLVICREYNHSGLCQAHTSCNVCRMSHTVASPLPTQPVAGACTCENGPQFAPLCAHVQVVRQLAHMSVHFVSIRMVYSKPSAFFPSSSSLPLSIFLCSLLFFLSPSSLHHNLGPCHWLSVSPPPHWPSPIPHTFIPFLTFLSPISCCFLFLLAISS